MHSPACYRSTLRLLLSTQHRPFHTQVRCRDVNLASTQQLWQRSLRLTSNAVGSSEGAPAELKTLETFPSGTTINKLESSVGLQPRQKVEDLPEELLDRLIQEYITQKPPLKLGKKGVWRAVASDLSQRWNTKEVIKIDAAKAKACKGDMKTTAEELEALTGGIVIWQSGAKLLIYRGYEKEQLKVKARPKAKAQAAAKPVETDAPQEENNPVKSVQGSNAPEVSTS